ncbi:hypothetical protein QGM71_03545 [Virgibacillus sp. C22-A2]|uniref:Uncharacterized protein n=1 Tax=Virgibacillus tibetensis TaxID=3042313 RepID=A0ABU6KCB7_9BACI|nr:hypothetical protein [Virgibacillus sp. C22-A2]
MYLIRNAIDVLRKEKIILPAIPTIERMVWFAKTRAEKKIYSILNSNLSGIHKHELEKLIDLTVKNSKTKLAWLREIPGQSSPDSFLKVIQRLKYIKEMNITVEASLIHSNKLLQLARIGSRYEPILLDDLKKKKDMHY